jgi:hypothetical protein
MAQKPMLRAEVYAQELHEEKFAFQTVDRLPVVYVTLASAKEAVGRLQALYEEKGCPSSR